MKVFLVLVLSLAIFSHAAFSQRVGGWTYVDPDTVNRSPAIQEALIFGASYAINQGIEDGTIEDSDYDIINIFSVREQVVAGTNYEFEVELATDSEYYVKLTFIVFVQPWKNSKRVTSYEFSPLLQQDEADIGNTESEFDFLPEEVGEGIPVPLESGKAKDTQIGGGWTPVELREMNSDSDLKSAFNFGIQQALLRLIEDRGLPREIYHETKIYSIEIQIVNGYNYRFDVEVTGNRGTVARIIFEVYSHPSTGTQKLTYSDLVSERN